MQRDSQARPTSVESESARELRIQGTKSSKGEARALRAQPPPQAYTGLCPSSKILREVWLVQGQERQIWDPTWIY